MQLVQRKIADSRTNQRFILLEGFCNTSKLVQKSQALQMRQMDEFFAIEKNIGEVVGVISLENEEEPANYVKTPDMW